MPDNMSQMLFTNPRIIAVTMVYKTCIDHMKIIITSGFFKHEILISKQYLI